LAEEAKTTSELFESMPSKATHEEDGRKYKVYEYQGEKFRVFEPKDGRMEIQGLGLTGAVFVHGATGQYRGEALGWGAGSDTPKGALDIACGQMVRRAARPTDEALQNVLGEFFESLH